MMHHQSSFIDSIAYAKLPRCIVCEESMDHALSPSYCSMQCMKKSKHEEENKEDEALLKKDVKSAVNTHTGTEQENEVEASASSQASEVVGASMKRKITPPKWFTPSEKKSLAAGDAVDGPPAANSNLSAQGKRAFHSASEDDENGAKREVKKIKLCSEADDVSEAANGDVLACNDYGPNYPESSDNEVDSESESKASNEDSSTAKAMGKTSKETDSKTYSVSPTEKYSALSSSDETDASTVRTSPSEGYSSDGDTNATSNDSEEADNGGDDALDEEDESEDESDESSGTRWRIAHGLQERTKKLSPYEYDDSYLDKKPSPTEDEFYLGDGWYGDEGCMHFIG
ncbi:MAG: hypothetical protein Q9228_001662 [Teloschistes exilis]